jgi:hypothetical protein
LTFIKKNAICLFMSTGYKDENGLTEKQRKFVAAYAGSVTEAAKAAGYKMHPGVAYSLMQNRNIQKALSKRLDKELNPLIREKRHRLTWLVDQINNEKWKIKDRLKAYELLARTCGDFFEVNVNQPGNGGSQAPPTVIVIKAGKESPVQVNINQGGEALPDNGEGLPVVEAVSGDNWPEE